MVIARNVNLASKSALFTFLLSHIHPPVSWDQGATVPVTIEDSYTFRTGDGTSAIAPHRPGGTSIKHRLPTYLDAKLSCANNHIGARDTTDTIFLIVAVLITTEGTQTLRYRVRDRQLLLPTGDRAIPTSHH